MEISEGGSLHSGAMEWEKRRLDMKTLKGKKYLAPLTTVVSFMILLFRSQMGEQLMKICQLLAR